MGATKKRHGVPYLAALIAVSAMFGGALGAWAYPTQRARAQTDTALAAGSTEDGPDAEAMPDTAARPNRATGRAADVWFMSPMSRDRSETLLYDNGMPLDDFRDPASQLSPPPAEPNWRFIAAAADDFQLSDVVSPDTTYTITLVRAAFSFFRAGSETATPLSDWEGIYVTVYGNSGLDLPGGIPDDAGGHAGDVVATQYVEIGPGNPNGVTEELVGICHPCWIVEIPVDLIVAKNTRYWLSLVPRFPAPPQTAWCYSEDDTGLSAQRGFPLIQVPFWNEVSGNLGCPNAAGCPIECADVDNPLGGTNKDLAFQLFGDETDPNIGACCDTSTGTCTDVSNPLDCSGPFEVFYPGTPCIFADCQPVTGSCCDDTAPGGDCTDDVNIADCPPTNRFTPGVDCADLDPECGTTDLGACCFPGQLCEDETPTDCASMGGVWHEGDCATFECPPENDGCEDAIGVVAGTHPFTTIGATTDGPPLDPLPPQCAEVHQDVWFKYVADCTGTLTISLCDGTDYDSALAVYEGCTCPPPDGSQVGCDNDACGVLSPGQIIANKISPSSYRHYLDDLLYTHDGDNRDAVSGPEHDPARSNIVTVLQGFGLQVELHAFTYNSATHYNVVATQLGSVHPDAQYIVGAHYDSAGTPGADDNASGVAGVMELARVLSQYTTEYTIKYIAFDLEEYGLLGSEAYVADHLTDDIRGMVSLDMLAYDAMDGACEVWGRSASNPIKNALATAVSLYGNGLVAHVEGQLDASDHAPFEWAGFSACLLIEADVWGSNPCYHQACDSVDNVGYISYPYAVAMTRAAAGFLADQALPDVPFMDGGPSQIQFAATKYTCYLIRLGGVGDATGTGNLSITCVSEGEGACCHSDEMCEVVPAGSCEAPGDTFFEGQTCENVVCPPYNDDCLDAIVVTDGTFSFDTLGATTDGPALDPALPQCAEVNQDIWFVYTASCDGYVVVSLCDAATYDSAIAVYEDAICPPVPGTQIACDNDACEVSGGSRVIFEAAVGFSYLIRIGGVDGATGSGVLHIECIPAFHGACCHADGDCEVLEDVDCTLPGDTFFLGVPCEAVTCPIPGACCHLDGACEDLTDVECAAVGDAFFAGQTCSETTCPTIGACCLLDGSCEVLEEADCTAAGGVLFAGQTCDEIECPAVGACCHADGSCDVLAEDACTAPNETFFTGLSCDEVTCPETTSECCPGDTDGDCHFDEDDIVLFVDRLLTPPAPDSLGFCQADVNRDGRVDGRDIAPFVENLLTGQVCPSYCPGDVNIDGTIDGLDIQGLVQAILAPPEYGSLIFCQADVDGNGDINLDDAAVLVQMLLSGAACP